VKILVTGGAGFIGSQIVDALVDAGADVIVVDSLDPGIWRRPPSYLRRDVRYFFQDLRALSPSPEFEGVEAVVHLAAIGGVARASREPAEVLDCNVGGTIQLIRQMLKWRQLRCVVLAGSFSVYGANYSYRVPSTGRILAAHRRRRDLEHGQYEVMDPATGEIAEIQAVTEVTPPNPLETYAASKWMQELAFRGIAALPVTTLRFSSVYGPRMRLDDGEATIIARLAGWISRNESPTLFEDGRQIRDWVYVGDIVEAVESLVLGGATSPSVVNACSGVPTTLVDACSILGRVFGTMVEPQIVGGFRPGDMRHCLGDPTAFSHLLGRRPTSFADGAPLAFAKRPEY
jgi:dTDP-L-rhamnose 4-epimerase